MTRARDRSSVPMVGRLEVFSHVWRPLRLAAVEAGQLVVAFL